MDTSPKLSRAESAGHVARIAHLARQAAVVVVVTIGATFALSVLAGSAEASHFRYGHLTWATDGTNTVEFGVQTAWRRTSVTCVDPATGGYTACSSDDDSYPAVGDLWEEGHSLYTGDGGAVRLVYLATAVDPENDWVFGVALDPNPSYTELDTKITHTYAVAGDYTASSSSCCRIGVSQPNYHVNNPDGSWQIETLVKVGTANRSPVSGLPPIVACEKDAVCTFQIPVADFDGDAFNFRFSTPSEAGGLTQPGPPHAPNVATVDEETGLYTWDTTGATLASYNDYNTLYSSQVMIQELDDSGDVRTSVPLDFFIQLVDDAGEPPAVEGTPECGTTQPVATGRKLSFDVVASDPDAGQTLTLNATGLPAGATMTPALPTTGNPVESTFSWTPTAAQKGSYAITFVATDDIGRMALCSVVVEAGRPLMAGRAVALSTGGLPAPLVVSDTGVHESDRESEAVESVGAGPAGVLRAVVATHPGHAAKDAAAVAHASLAGGTVASGDTRIEFGLVEAAVTTTCTGSAASTSIAFLTIDGERVVEDGQEIEPGRTIELGNGVSVVLNEHRLDADGMAMEVTAVRVISPAGEVAIGTAATRVTDCP